MQFLLQCDAPAMASPALHVASHMLVKMGTHFFQAYVSNHTAIKSKDTQKTVLFLNSESSGLGRGAGRGGDKSNIQKCFISKCLWSIDQDVNSES